MSRPVQPIEAVPAESQPTIPHAFLDTLKRSESKIEQELLTADEHEAMRLSAELANVLGRIIGPTCNDTFEMVKDIHAIQRLILSQAGARAYPELYRTLGDVAVSPTSE